jgi:hypothetical protein
VILFLRFSARQLPLDAIWPLPALGRAGDVQRADQLLRWSPDFGGTEKTTSKETQT